MKNDDCKVLIYNDKMAITRTVMMLFVVLCHSCSVYTGSGWGGYLPTGSSEFWGNIAKVLGIIHTQMFTFVSGYFFYYSRYIKNDYRSGRADIIKRVKRLLVPYIFASVAWVIPSYWCIYGFSIGETIIRFVFAESPAQLWFLVMLLGEYILFYYFSDVCLKYNKIVVCVSLLLLGDISIFGSRFLPLRYFQINTILQYLIYYYLGFCFCAKTIKRINAKHAVLFLALFIVLSVMYLKASAFSTTIGLLVKPFASISGIFAILAVICNTHIDRYLGQPVIQVFVKYGMGVYLLHQQLIYCTVRLFDKMNLSETSVVFLNFSCSLFVSIFISWLADHNNVTKKLLGI